MNNVTPIPVRLEAFEGPLDLLLHLIDKNKINIYDIPVSEITDQYLAYVDQMKEENMEVTSEFLVMAATLLDLKSRMLLPREEEEEEEEGDPREELVQRLLDYKLTKYQSEELRDKSEEASRNVFRNQDLPKEVKNYQPPVDYDELLGRTTLQSLTKIFEDVLKRQKNRMDPVRSTFGRIEKEEISVEEKTSQLMEYFRHCEKTSFRALLEGQTSRQGLIVTFLILLDFIKSGIVHIRQGEIFGEIEIFAGALPEGGMGPQEILPSNKAEARALRKAKKKQEKGEALSAKADLPDETEPDETEPVAEEKEIAVESSHYYKPRVVLSQPRADAENPASLEDSQVITVKAEGQEDSSEQEEKESAAGLPEKEAADLEDTAAEQEASEEEPAEEELSEEEPSEEASEEEPVEKELSEEEPAEEEPVEEEPAEEAPFEEEPEEEEPAEEESFEEEPFEEEDDDPAAEEDFEESEGSAVYRLIQSKDWETVLDEYMEDEGLAELLEEEKKIPKEDTDPAEEEPEEEEDFETEEEPEAEAERVSESEEDFGAEEEAESEEFPEVEGVPEVEEKAQAREVSEAEEEPEEDFEAEEAPEEGEVPEAEEEPKSEEIPEIKQDSEEEAVPSPEESVEETWKQAESPQPSRLYYSPWAVQWRYQKSPQPWKSQKKKPGRQWKRSARSSTMRRAVFRSIAMMMPYSSRPGQNTTNT